MQESHKILEDFFITQNIKYTRLAIEGFISYIIENTEAITKILNFAAENEYLRFNLLSDLFAADFPEKINRFEIVYNLLSLKLNQRLIIKINISEDQSLPSISSIFSVADWYEREIYDMFGVNFVNHPGLTRILTDYGFTGYPLRKDFPLTGHTQIRYDEQQKKIIHEPVFLEQEYRDFDFESPWQGPEYNNLLPGDEKASLNLTKKDIK